VLMPNEYLDELRIIAVKHPENNSG
jgi:hypothetical protein